MPAAVIVDYDPAWPIRAAGLLNEVRAAFATLPYADRFAYEHIGSTAIPGLAAKPIVDLQVRMPALPDLAGRPGISDPPRATDRLAVRRLRRRLPRLAPGATRNTRALAERHAGDPDYDDYTRAKTAFLDEIQPELRDWVRHRRS